MDTETLTGRYAALAIWLALTLAAMAGAGAALMASYGEFS